jgi:hypothetical protein
MKGIFRLPSAAMVVAVAALVLALGGGAYAAKKYVITSTGQIKPSVLKSLQGRAGTTGATGPAGAQGEQGTRGKAGVEGQPGPEGPEGLPGEPGPTETTLPSGKTETGLWSFDGHEVLGVVVTESFPLRTTFTPDFHWIRGGGPTAECPGTAAEPQAEAGQLCLYAGPEVFFEGVEPTVLSGQLDPTSGFSLEFPIQAGEEDYGSGSWAVAAP